MAKLLITVILLTIAAQLLPVQSNACTQIAASGAPAYTA